MWIISKEYGAFNTDNLSAIQRPNDLDDYKFVVALDGRCGHRVTRGLDNYHKIIDAIRNCDDYVEVD